MSDSVPYYSHNKERLLPQTTLTGPCNGCVFCEVGTEINITYLVKNQHYIIATQVNKKVKVTLEQATKTQSGVEV
jgi:hypothetical protein